MGQISEFVSKHMVPNHYQDLQPGLPGRSKKYTGTIAPRYILKARLDEHDMDDHKGHKPVKVFVFYSIQDFLSEI